MKIPNNCRKCKWGTLYVFAKGGIFYNSAIIREFQTFGNLKSAEIRSLEFGLLLLLRGGVPIAGRKGLIILIPRYETVKRLRASDVAGTPGTSPEHTTVSRVSSETLR